MDPIRIAVDVAGGDFGTPVVLKGVLDARGRRPGEFIATLCGDRTAIERVLLEHGESPSAPDIAIEHCPDRIGPTESPSRAWSNHERSSIVRCISLQREGAVDASICPGDTGVLLAAAVFILGRMNGFSRPALAATVPTAADRPALVLDVGANVNCRAEHLVAFAAMGREYVQRFYGIEAPRIALLNVGVEPVKGPRAILEAARQLEKDYEGFAGFIEGTRVLSGDADVIVCDGFAGNVLLKVCESFYALTESVLGERPDVLSVVRENMSILDAESYGAVPLLGINGVVLKAHGSSSPRAISSAIDTTISVGRHEVIRLPFPSRAKGYQPSYAI